MNPVLAQTLPWKTVVIALALAAVAIVLSLLLASRLLRPSLPHADRRRRASLDAGALAILLVGMGAWIAWAAIGAIAGRLVHDAVTLDALSAGMLASAVGFAAGIGTIFALLPLASVGRRALGVTRFGASDLGWGLLSLVVGLPVLYLVSMLAFAAAAWIAQRTGAEPPSVLAHQTLADLFSAPRDSEFGFRLALVAFVAVGLAPVFEELLYRGCLQTSLRTVTRSAPVAIIAASLLFSLIHAGVVGWHAMPSLLVVGVIAGWLLEHTGKIWPSILFHAGFNAANLALAFLAGAQPPA